jgi:hypothetical protein
MATKTLLELTQDVLSSIDSDEVNSISDTVESMQIATIIKNKYYDILTRSNLPLDNQLFQLNPSNDSSLPVLMYVPAAVDHIEWIKYFDSNPANSQQVRQFGSYSHGLNLDLVSTSSWITTSSTSVLVGLGTKTFTVASASLPIINGQGVLAISGTASMFGTVTSYIGTTLIMNAVSFTGSGTLTNWTLTNNQSSSVPGYKYVTMLPIDQFLDEVNRFNPADSNVRTYTFTEGGNNFTFCYKNNRQPQYCTVISNFYIIFDMYDSNFDSTLQSSKTLVYGRLTPVFQMSDSFIPPLDDNQFPLLYNEAKAAAFVELKQMPNPKAEQEIKRQWSAVQKNKKVSDKPSSFEALPDFGRMPRTGGYSSGGYGAYKWMRGTSGN